MTRMSRAVVMPGDGTWELRELPVPDPPPGGAVLRVEAVGLCHSDIDHMHGIVHTPWGGAYPSIPGHEIVGRIDALAPGTGARWGVTEGQRVAVRESVPLAGGIRVYGHDFGIDERSGLFGGFADYMELLPETLVEPLPDDIPADELTVWEPLAIAVRWATAVKPGNSVAILGPGHLGLASIVAARAAGAERIFITGTPADALRLDAARALGVEEAIDISAADPVERIRELTGGRGRRGDRRRLRLDEHRHPGHADGQARRHGRDRRPEGPQAGRRLHQRLDSDAAAPPARRLPRRPRQDLGRADQAGQGADRRAARRDRHRRRPRTTRSSSCPARSPAATRSAWRCGWPADGSV